MNIHFYDDPSQLYRPPEAVRLNQLGVQLYPDGRRVAVGFDITPFQQRPSLQVLVTNGQGEVAGRLTVIEAMSPNFSLTVHLRDRQPANPYQVQVELYYANPGEARRVVDVHTATFSLPALPDPD